MKRILFTVLFTLLALITYAQKKKTIYFDENYETISLKKFDKKAGLNFFLVATIKNDTTTFKKLRFKEFFGKLSIKKKSQLNKLFKKRFEIDTTKVWLIHYIDSLPNVKKMYKKSGFVFLDSMGDDVGEVLTKKEFKNVTLSNSSSLVDKNKRYINKRHKHVVDYESYKRIIPNEVEKYSRFKKLELLHFYNYNKGYPTEDIQLEKWFKDGNLVLRKIFTDGIAMYRTIVIHPNGNFYIVAHNISYDKQKNKINFKSYKRAKKKWRKEYEKYH